MNCVKCHEGSDLHGTATDTSTMDISRYSGTEDPKCVDCHPTVAPGGDSNPMHQAHGDSLSCQVCHSITYTSCDGCHVAVSEKSGNPFFETEATYSTFLIGRNPNQTEERPYKYVPVRHVPVATTSYQFYGENVLSNFDALPTWIYATPHNIQKNTPQNASCQSCHGSDGSIFLTVDKVSEEELTANQNVIVNMVPPAIELFLNATDMPPSHLDLVSNSCTACHTTGISNAPISPEDHASYTDENCSGCHKLPQ